MKLYTLILSFILPLALLAEKPSEESIHELMELSGGKQILESVWGQMEAMMNANSAELLKDVEDQDQAMEMSRRLNRELIQFFEEEMNWDFLMGIYVPVYQDVFTQHDIDQLVEFYRSAVGQMYVDRQPVLIQRTMSTLQSHMIPMIGRLQERVEKVVDAFIEELELEEYGEEP